MLICIEMLSIVEKALLVKLYYKNSENDISSFRESRFLKGMRDDKGSITCSELNKIMKKFEATGFLAPRPRSGCPSAAAAVATSVEQTVQSMSAVSAHGECNAREVSRQTGLSTQASWGLKLRRWKRSILIPTLHSVLKYLESTANNLKR